MRVSVLLLVVAGAALGYAQEDAQAHYRPILERDPFRPRLFLPPTAPSAPVPVTLRLTCIVKAAGGHEALLEKSGTDEGAFLRAGERLGELEVVEVNAAGLVVRTPAGTRAIALGDCLELAPSSVALEVLAPKNTGWPTGVAPSKDRTYPSDEKVKRGDSR
ncbi:MAG TPA: hypothetical protein VFF73_36505 [Planctomycetota bacterium]|nr:hypothetical protein [Planctomycetota bacterium]